MIFECDKCGNILDFFSEEQRTCTGCDTTYDLICEQSDDYGYEYDIKRVEDYE